jgi:hypothetical protein
MSCAAGEAKTRRRDDQPSAALGDRYRYIPQWSLRPRNRFLFFFHSFFLSLFYYYYFSPCPRPTAPPSRVALIAAHFFALPVPAARAYISTHVLPTARNVYERMCVHVTWQNPPSAVAKHPRSYEACTDQRMCAVRVGARAVCVSKYSADRSRTRWWENKIFATGCRTGIAALVKRNYCSGEP